MNNEDKLFDILALMQNSIDETKNMQKDILNKVNKLESETNDINKKLDSLITDFKTTEQITAKNFSDVTVLKSETNGINKKLDSLTSDFKIIEQVTAKNYNDVSILKNAK